MINYISCPNCNEKIIEENNICTHCYFNLRSTKNSLSIHSTNNVNNNQKNHQSQNLQSPTKQPPPPTPPQQPSIIQTTPIVSNNPQQSIISPNPNLINSYSGNTAQLYPIPSNIISKRGNPEIEGRISDIINSENKDRSISSGDIIRATVGTALLFKNVYAGLMTLTGLGTQKPSKKIIVIRLEQLSNQVEVRIEGDLLRGYPSIGDFIAFWGFFSNNVLIADHGFNRLTGAELVIK